MVRLRLSQDYRVHHGHTSQAIFCFTTAFLIKSVLNSWAIVTDALITFIKRGDIELTNVGHKGCGRELWSKPLSTRNLVWWLKCLHETFCARELRFSVKLSAFKLFATSTLAINYWSNFPSVPDRLWQASKNLQVIGKWKIAPETMFSTTVGNNVFHEAKKYIKF